MVLLRKVFILIFSVFVGPILSHAQETAGIWWSPALHLQSLDDVSTQMHAQVPLQQAVTLSNGKTQQIVRDCVNYIALSARHFYPPSNADAGAAAPFTRRCYALTYLQDARAAKTNYLGEASSAASVLIPSTLPPFSAGVEGASTKVSAARQKGLSWKQFDPSVTETSSSPGTVSLQNQTSTFTITPLVSADLNGDGVQDMALLICTQARRGSFHDCAAEVITRLRPGAVDQVLSSLSPPYRITFAGTNAP